MNKYTIPIITKSNYFVNTYIYVLDRQTLHFSYACAFGVIS